MYPTLEALINTVESICSNEQVRYILDVYFSTRDVMLRSDIFRIAKGKKKLQLTPEAKIAKTYGLQLKEDCPFDAAHHLPPGLTGVKEVLKMMRRSPENYYHLIINVIWANGYAGKIIMRYEDRDRTGELLLEDGELKVTMRTEQKRRKGKKTNDNTNKI